MFTRATTIANLFLSLNLLPTFAAAQDLGSDGSWVSLQGTVVRQDTDALLLDYGEGTIVVEVDDWEWREEAEPAMSGDQVTVYGRVDDGFYTDKRIEAQSIYVDDLNTVLTGPSPYDEEGSVDDRRYTYYAGPTQYDMEITGLVTSVDGRQFTIDTGERELRVDTTLMSYNPMDDIGFQQVQEGDWVRASGDLAMNTLERRELMAESVVTLQQGSAE